MTTQLQNQDPFAPMDNGDFAQMAQFSTVTGIEEMNSNLGKLVEEFDQARIATASNLLGHSVLVPGILVDPMKTESCMGSLIYLRRQSTTELIYRDADTNSELFRDELGPKGSGLVGFKWDDIPIEILENNKSV